MNNKKKIVCFCRVSTSSQDVQQQIEVTKKYAITTLGYNEKDIIVLSGTGASAVKCNEIYMQQINELYRLIESGEVLAVISFHLNRLCRNSLIAMTLKEKLISCSTQLHIIEPTLNLLRADNSVDSGSELAFALFSTLNEQNAKELKEKTLRGKEYKKSQQKFIGGGVSLGFRVDEDDRIVVDEDNKYIVQHIFNLYLEGYSFKKLSKELVETNMHKTTKTGVRNILTQVKYRGVIIDETTFDNVQKKIKENCVSRNHKHYFFCSRLITCSCGYHYNYHSNDMMYVCSQYTKDRKHTNGILIYIIDGIVYKIVHDKIDDDNKKSFENNKKNIVKKIDNITQKSIKLESDISKFKNKYEKLHTMYLDDFITKQEYESKYKQLNIKENQLKYQLKEYEQQLNKLTTLFTDKQEYNILDTNSAIEVQRIIRQYIKNITLVDKQLTITLVDDNVHIYYYNGRKRKHKVYSDKECTLPIYFPTIHHHNETFEIKKG